MSKITHRYAKALIDLAIERNLLDQCLNDMKIIIEVCEDNHELLLLLKSPIVNTDKKLSVLSLIFEERVSEMTSLFIEIITRKKREALLPSIAENFIHLHKLHNNITTAKVTTVDPLDEDLKKLVSQFVQSITSIDVEIEEAIDESILGGTIIKIGDQQLDGSVKRNLKELKNTYKENLYIKDF